jgi:hypothetical protein
MEEMSLQCPWESVGVDLLAAACEKLDISYYLPKPSQYPLDKPSEGPGPSHTAHITACICPIHTACIFLQWTPSKQYLIDEMPIQCP